MREFIVYMATNRINETSYIGKTSNTLHNRKVDHIYEAFKRVRKDKFHSAIREFGIENFEWNILERSNNFTNLMKLENKLIKKYNTIENGYNTQIRKDLSK